LRQQNAGDTGNPGLFEGDVWVDGEFLVARETLVHGLLSCYWLWCERDGLSPPSLPAVERFLPLDLQDGGLWGEGAIPQLLAHCWFVARKLGVPLGVSLLAGLLRAVLDRQTGDSMRPLPSPYYSIEDVVRHSHPDILLCEDPFDGDTFAGSSFAAAAPPQE
jgi:hypothetical protein